LARFAHNRIDLDVSERLGAVSDRSLKLLTHHAATSSAFLAILHDTEDRVPGDSEVSKDTISKAVRDRSPVRFRYEDETADRVLAPHVVFRSKAGETMVGGRQISNPNDKREAGEWVELPIRKLKNVALTDGIFRVDASFQPFSTAYMGRMVCHAFQHG
jgi:hypothetical protein